MNAILIAQKLGRTVYYMLKRREAFNPDKFYGDKKIENTAKNLYEKKCNSSEEEFPVGRIVIDFKKVEEACRNYKK